MSAGPSLRRKPPHLGDRLAAQSEHSSRFPSALLLIENEIAHRRVDLHSEHPRQPRKGAAYRVDDFYTARTGKGARASLDGFLTAMHIARQSSAVRLRIPISKAPAYGVTERTRWSIDETTFLTDLTTATLALVCRPSPLTA